MVNFIKFIGIIGFASTVEGNQKSHKLPIRIRKRSLLLMTTFVLLLLITVGCQENNERTPGINNDGLINDVENNNEEKIDNEAKAKKVDTTDTNLETLKVHFIDVGQADAALLEFSDENGNYNILIDSGDWNSNGAITYLKQLGTRDIDLLVGTHPHSDHIGQMDNIINEFNVDEVWMSGDIATSQVFERVIDAIETNDVGYNEPRAGEEYEIGPLHIEVVSPHSLNGHLNNGSIVMRLTYGSVTFLFAGDAEKEAEQGMLTRGETLKSDILKVGHHGSDTSSTQGFINEVSPKVAVISVGKSNQYGHPSPSVIDRFQKMKIELYSTKDHGTVIIETNGNDYTITTKEDGNVTLASSGGSQTNNQGKTNKKKKRASNDACIDINSASLEEVQKIIHIGPSRAQSLINLRPYNSVQDLEKISGIGPSRMNDIQNQDLACVGG